MACRFLIIVLLFCFLSAQMDVKLSGLARELARCGSQCGHYAPLLVDNSVRERQINGSCFNECSTMDLLLSVEDFRELAKATVDAKVDSLEVLCVEKFHNDMSLIKFLLPSDDSFFPMKAPSNFAVVRLVSLWQRILVDGAWKEQVVRVQYGFATTFSVPLNSNVNQFRIEVKTFTQHGAIGRTQATDWLTQDDLQAFPQLRQNEKQDSLVPLLDYYCRRFSEYILLGELVSKAKEESVDSQVSGSHLKATSLFGLLCVLLIALVLLCVLVLCRFLKRSSGKEENSCTIELQRNSQPGSASYDDQSKVCPVLRSPSSFWENTHLAAHSTPKPPF